MKVRKDCKSMSFLVKTEIGKNGHKGYSLSNNGHNFSMGSENIKKWTIPRQFSTEMFRLTNCPYCHRRRRQFIMMYWENGG